MAGRVLFLRSVRSGEVPAGSAAGPGPASAVPAATAGAASPARIGSPVDVRLADVKLVGLLQLGRAGRLHVVANRPELELAEVQRFLLCGVQLPAVRLRRDVADFVRLAQRLMHGTADGDVQRAHLPVAYESFPAARVVRVERPAAVERLQRVTDRLRHDPGPELLIGEPVAGALDEGQQVGGCHDALVSPGGSLGLLPCPAAAWRGTPPDVRGGIRRGALGRIPGAGRTAWHRREPDR